MPAALMIGHHFSMSAFCSAPQQFIRTLDKKKDYLAFVPYRRRGVLFTHRAAMRHRL
jgi:hypothetical protein